MFRCNVRKIILSVKYITDFDETKTKIIVEIPGVFIAKFIFGGINYCLVCTKLKKKLDIKIIDITFSLVITF